MNKLSCIVIVCSALVFKSFAQVPSIEWQKTFGGSDFDYLNHTIQTIDGGFLLGGTSRSPINTGNKTTATSIDTLQNGDYWIIKTDACGLKEWEKSYGGSKSETLNCVLQTADGGYLLGGNSYSGVDGDKTDSNNDTTYSTSDFWVIKVDENGEKIWDKTYGSQSNDQINAIISTDDGGYFLGGYAGSQDHDVTDTFFGFIDYWLIKIDNSGEILWDKTYGGTGAEKITTIKKIKTNSYALGGSSTSSSASGNKLVDNWGNGSVPGAGDFWLVIVNENGEVVSQQVYGGTGGEFLNAGHFDLVEVTDDGNLLIGIPSESNISGNKTEINRGPAWSFDYWLAKVNPDSLDNPTNYGVLWDKTLGAKHNDTSDNIAYLLQSIDVITSIKFLSNGNVLVGGYSNSDANGDRTEDNFNSTNSQSNENSDFWIIMLDGSNGQVVWDKVYGGTSKDVMTTCVETTSGALILSGHSSSGVNGNKTSPNFGNSDFWLIRLEGNIPCEEDTILSNILSVAKKDIQFNIYPNPATNKLMLNITDEFLQQRLSVSIYDLTGKKIYMNESLLSNNVEIDVSEYTKGIYTLVISDKSKYSSQRILIY